MLCCFFSVLDHSAYQADLPLFTTPLSFVLHLSRFKRIISISHLLVTERWLLLFINASSHLRPSVRNPFPWSDAESRAEKALHSQLDKRFMVSVQCQGGLRSGSEADACDNRIKTPNPEAPTTWVIYLRILFPISSSPFAHS